MGMKKNRFLMYGSVIYLLGFLGFLASRVFFLEGSWLNGVWPYFTDIKWSHLWRVRIWVEAAIQIFLQLSLGLGIGKLFPVTKKNRPDPSKLQKSEQ
jgi:SNF family Na+-dependent transporter